MPQFLNEFFPQVAARQKAAAPQKSAYCTFDDGGLQAWTSSMFIAGAITGERSHLARSSSQPLHMRRLATYCRELHATVIILHAC